MDADLKSVPVLQDSGKNWLHWSTRVKHLLRARGLFGLVDPEDPVAKAILVAEKAAAEEQKSKKKLEFKQVMGRSQAMYVLYQTVAAGHQLNIRLLEDPREA